MGKPRVTPRALRPHLDAQSAMVLLYGENSYFALRLCWPLFLAFGSHLIVKQCFARQAAVSLQTDVPAVVSIRPRRDRGG